MCRQKNNAVAIALAAVAAAVIALSGCKKQDNYISAQFTGDTFTTSSIASLQDKTPVFYSYADGARQIRFFVVKVNGRVSSYFDVCNTCKEHNRGYRADKEFIECRNCQIQIAYEDLNTGVGGCYPIPLQGREENGAYSISRADIAAGRQLFP
ncbi:MAG: DUF2318 domain-containing protein [Candidatus Magnetominusculus sp. LBB02]|nr:DUF2318 domain-containing protein [Candidatus Magnetominusculus sp. LBB02]